MDDLARANLSSKVQEASLLREWCRQEGFKIWKKELDTRIEDLKNEWIKADDELGKEDQTTCSGLQRNTRYYQEEDS